jgi:toxin secretion/phage lysis holin
MSRESLMESIVRLYEMHPLVFLLGCLMGLDILTGGCAAWIEKRLSSKISMAGMLRKCMVVLFMGMAAAIEKAQPDIPLVKLCCMFFMYTEALSILENAKRAGIPMPPAISASLDTMRKNSTTVFPTDIHLSVKSAEMDVQQTVSPIEPPKKT